MSALGPIGVFDSGVGGLSVVAELVKRLPGEDLIYFGDAARVPYGIRSPGVIREFSLEIGAWLVSQGAKVLVAACNTASSVAREYLAERLPVPVIGVVEAGARMAAEHSRNGRIAVIGTASTIDSRAYPQALERLNPALKTYSRACPLFVPMVEEGLFKGPVVDTVISHYLADLTEKDVDTLVLGCTHYPLLRASIERQLGSAIRIVDAAEGTAGEVERVLDAQGLSSTQLQKGSHRFVFSDRTAAFQELARRILPEFMGDMEVLNVESDAFRNPVSKLGQDV